MTAVHSKTKESARLRLLDDSGLFDSTPHPNVENVTDRLQVHYVTSTTRAFPIEKDRLFRLASAGFNR